MAGAEGADGVVELTGAELAAVIGHDALQTPAAIGEVGGDAAGQRRGEPCPRRARGDVELGPAISRAHVDGGVLPDRAVHAGEAAHVEAVHLDQLARPISLDVPGWRWWWPLQLGWGGRTGDEAQAGPTGIQALAPQHMPDAVR